jgi:hypothetical protein
MENGYQSSWTCIYNVSMDSNFTVLVNVEGRIVWRYFVRDPISGALGNWTFSGGDKNIIAPIRFNFSGDIWRQNYAVPFLYTTIGVVSDKYAGLNNMQCAYRAIPQHSAVPS